MVEPVFDAKLGVWRCPLCGWTAMSKKVVEAHIKRSHPEAFQNGQKVIEEPNLNEQKTHKNEKAKSNKEKGENGKRGKERGGKWQSFRISGTKIKILKRPEVEVRDQLGWRFFLTANYVAALHKQRARVKLITGEEFEGILKARDPYFVALIMEGGERIYINKAHIVWIRPMRGDEE